MEVKTLFETIYNEHSPNLQPVNLPGWWCLTFKSLEENLEWNEKDQLVWLELQKVLVKILNIWLRKSKKWEVTSLTMLLEKISKVPGDILAMSFCSKVCSTVIELWKGCANMEDLDEQECLDFQSNPTTFTSSMTAPIVMEVAGTSGGGKLSLLEQLDQLAPRTNKYTNSQQQTGTMSSSISFCRNGAQEKYILEEKVGRRRLTLNWYDGKKSLTLGDKWYEAKLMGATLTVNDLKTIELVEQLLVHLQMKFMAKNPRLEENIPTLNRKRKYYS